MWPGRRGYKRQTGGSGPHWVQGSTLVHSAPTHFSWSPQSERLLSQDLRGQYMGESSRRKSSVVQSAGALPPCTLLPSSDCAYGTDGNWWELATQVEEPEETSRISGISSLLLSSNPTFPKISHPPSSRQRWEWEGRGDICGVHHPAEQWRNVSD